MSITFFYRNILISISNIIIGACNWAFLFIVLKYIERNEANTFIAFISIFLLLSIPSSTISYITNKIGKNLLIWVKNNQNKSIIAISLYLLFCAIFSLAYGFSIIFTLYLCILIILTLISSYNKALLQHNLQFVKFSIVSIIEVIIKIAFLYFTILSINNSAWIAVGLQYIIGALLPIVFNLFLNDTKEQAEIPFNFQTLATATAFSASLIIFTNIDTLIGKSILESFDFNIYQKILQLSKVLLFFSTGLNLVLMPSILSEINHKSILKMFGITLVIEVLFSIFFIILIINFNDKILPIFSIPASHFTSVLMILVSIGIYSIAQSISFVLFRENSWKKIALITLTISVIQIVGYYFQDNLAEFAYMNLFASVILLLLTSIGSYKYLKKFLQ